MTSFKQIEANRRNALKSTGPTTREGKRRCAQNATRHGLTSETTIVALEDLEDYTAFERAVIADYTGETAVERELALRLASLLWRLRRATAIETGLFEMQATDGDEAEHVAGITSEADGAVSLFGTEPPRNSQSHQCTANDSLKPQPPTANQMLNLARCFLGLTSLDNAIFERLGRYEMALWRQTRQLMFSLELLRHKGEGIHARKSASWLRWSTKSIGV